MEKVRIVNQRSCRHGQIGTVECWDADQPAGLSEAEAQATGNVLVRFGEAGDPEAFFREEVAVLTLERVLQSLYDSEINVTITMLWDGGFDFAFVSYMELGQSTPYNNDEKDWETVERAEHLAEAIHKAALEKYPGSAYVLGKDEHMRRYLLSQQQKAT